MTALSQYNSIDYNCNPNPTYEDYVANGYETVGCGNIYTATATLYSFAVIGMLIFLNLFIAIIL